MKRDIIDRAISDRNMDMLIHAVKSGLDISQPFQDEFKMTPLWCALEWHQGLNFLIKSGADPDVQGGDFGTTALMMAASHGHLKATQILIEAGANVNIKDEEDTTALWNACCGNTKAKQRIAFMLLDAGADVHGGNTRPVICVAACYARPEVLLRLIHEGADVDASSELDVCPIYQAICANNKNNLAILLGAGADPLVVVKPTKKPMEGSLIYRMIGMNMIDVARHLGFSQMVKTLEGTTARK